MGAFLEIVIPLDADFSLQPHERHELEEAIGDVLAPGLGEVSGGGTAADAAIIDVDVADGADERLVVDRLRGVLVRLGVPADTIIQRHRPTHLTWRVGRAEP